MQKKRGGRSHRLGFQRGLPGEERPDSCRCEFLVASGVDGEVDELRLGKGISCAWSAGSIAFCDGGEARLEVERAAGASGDGHWRRFSAKYDKRRVSTCAQGRGKSRGTEIGLQGHLFSSESSEDSRKYLRAPARDFAGLAAYSREEGTENRQGGLGIL
jgi:hypothetical protein